MTPATFTLVANKRVPFGAIIAFAGLDYSAAAFSMHIRKEPGDTGTPLISLSGGSGISVSYETDYEYTDEEGVLNQVASSVTYISIAEAAIEALPLNNPANRPLYLAYDLHITPVGGVKFVALQGPFIINPGVTI
jgi:hypothetical protein